MKRLFILSVALALMLGVAVAGENETKPESICPKTLMKDSCLTCHSYPTFILKEINPESRYEYPVTNMRLVGDTAYYVLQGVRAGEVQNFFDYILWHPFVKKIVIEVHSPGGSLFDGYKIVGMMQHMMTQGYIIETRVYGFAASAGCLIAASGSRGKRFTVKTSEWMWHELMSFTLFSIDTPSDSEEKARVLRHLQNTANVWLSSVSKLSVDDLNERIRKKEFWMSGSEAVEFGFADGFLK